MIADFNQIADDLQALLRTGLDGTVRPQHIMIDAMDTERGLNQMPYVDIRLQASEPQVRAGQDYYGGTTYDLYVAAFDLSSYRKAATLRNEIVRTIMATVRGTPRFSADLETSVTAGAEFDALESEKGKGFVAIAVVRIVCYVYEDR